MKKPRDTGLTDASSTLACMSSHLPAQVLQMPCDKGGHKAVRMVQRKILQKMLRCLPTQLSLSWTAYSQGHELLLLSVAGWLVWRQRDATSAGRPERLGAIFWLAWGLCLLGYAPTVFGQPPRGLTEYGCGIRLRFLVTFRKSVC